MKILYPMDMEEFMLAMGEGSLVEQIKKCFAADVPLPSALHHAAMGLYRQYLVVGGMAENYVNVQLSINGYSTYYWESDRGAEIDFVIQREGKLIPIEVKSADNTKAKSLKVYMETYKPDYAIKLSAKNFGFEDGKRLFPFMLHFASDQITGSGYAASFCVYGCCFPDQEDERMISYNPVCIHSFREALLMKNREYVLETTKQPDIDKLDCKDFKINFQRAILLSLLESRKLTQAQFEACMDKVVQKYSAPFS